MIDFLEQLERDLVEAIDRRETARAPRRRRLRLELVAAAAAVALAIGLVLVLNSQREKEQPATHPTPTVTNPRPVPKGTPLHIRGVMRSLGADRWEGRVAGPDGGPGTLTLIGPVDLTPRPCCEGFHQANTHVLQFRWTSPRGTIGGCVVNTTYRRPHERFVWDGPGRVKVATGAFARYLGREIAIGGASDIRLTTRALIVLGHDGRPPGRC